MIKLEIQLNNIHENMVLKIGAALISATEVDVLAIGKKLNEMSSDHVTTGGFWLYDVVTKKMYYSPKFKASFGFDECDEFAPEYSTFTQYANQEDLEKNETLIREVIAAKSEQCFTNKVRYTTRYGLNFTVNCSGTVLYKNNTPIIVLGSHEIID